MRTRSQSRRHRQQQVPQTSVESPNLEKPNNNQESPVVTMADNRTMAELLQAPTEGYEDAIVVPAITADNFELKHSLLTLVQNKQFFGHDKEDPHAHIRYFNKITSTMRFPNVPNTSIKLMLFPFSLEGAARIWLKKEPPRSILTWDDLVSKFINEFFPSSKKDLFFVLRLPYLQTNVLTSLSVRPEIVLGISFEHVLIMVFLNYTNLIRSLML
ncbi:reverse transcriptase domain-containing protein [Tanacetum coccineum]|uniref:Reverse transcriptase domain-containing protein n=1 Tax=Tanacetum coccineum TaxID=301880 RepID=A0ABQ4YE01_9ASTR